MSNRIHIPGQQQEHDARVMQTMIAAAVQRALSDGAAIPMRMVGQDLQFPPPHPIEGPDGYWVVLTRCVTLAPFYHGTAFRPSKDAVPDSQHTAVYLPSYQMMRHSGIILTADQKGLRPYIQHVAEMKCFVQFPEDDEETMASYYVPYRSELTLELFTSRRVAEINRVPLQPWMSITLKDLKEFGTFVESMMLQLGRVKLESLSDPVFIETLTRRFVATKRAETCERHGCESGRFTDGRTTGVCGHLDCFLRGSLEQYGPPQSTENDASTAAGEESSEDSSPETSSD